MVSQKSRQVAVSAQAGSVAQANVPRPVSVSLHFVLLHVGFFAHAGLCVISGRLLLLWDLASTPSPAQEAKARFCAAFYLVFLPGTVPVAVENGMA